MVQPALPSRTEWSQPQFMLWRLMKLSAVKQQDKTLLDLMKLFLFSAQIKSN